MKICLGSGRKQVEMSEPAGSFLKILVGHAFPPTPFFLVRFFLNEAKVPDAIYSGKGVFCKCI